MKKQFKDCLGLFVRYKSNTTDADGGTAWNGMVRDVEGEDGEVCINGAMHKIDSIEILEIITIEE